jgi:hypothetical protein
MIPDAAQKQETFFKLAFGQERGLVCIAYLTQFKREFREEYFAYPNDLSQMLGAINRDTLNTNVYFCPQLLKAKKRIKENVTKTHTAWADLDTCHPDNLLVKPSIVVQSSPDRYQALWVLKDVDPDDAEDLSRRIAYRHEDQGADRSGWDLTQLLRVPYTYNYKYDAPVVSVIHATRAEYNIEDFDEYPATPDYIRTEIPFQEKQTCRHLLTIFCKCGAQASTL